MNGRAYYNENSPYPAQWLRNLIDAGFIPPGDVDERDIQDISPDDLRGYTQCHFFAGIGGWRFALRLIGWPDDRPVWTGSCPCQPYSSAGQRGGFADERHLWPFWHWLIQHREPPVVFGEQVASKSALDWVDLVSADLEGTGYAGWFEDSCSASVGAPHIRQRMWFAAERMADADFVRQPGQGVMGRPRNTTTGSHREVGGVVNAGRGDGLVDPHRAGPQPGQRDDPTARQGDTVAATGGDGRLADADQQRGGRRGVQRPGEGVGACVGAALERPERLCEDHRPGPVNGFWRDADWLGCRDGKWRPVEPGTFPLAHGVSGRMVVRRATGQADAATQTEIEEHWYNRAGALHGIGNAINPWQAAEFIRGYLNGEGE